MLSKIIKAVFKFLTYPFHRGRFVLLLLFAFRCHGQVDSCRILAKELKDFKNSQSITISNMQFNLRRHSDLFNIGTGLQIGGIGVMCLSIPTSETFPESAKGLIITGGVLVIIGTVVNIVSHKYIGKAGGK
jgi:hypothetical protein